MLDNLTNYSDLFCNLSVHSSKDTGSRPWNSKHIKKILWRKNIYVNPITLCFQTALKHISTAPKIHSSGFCHYWLCCVMILGFVIIIFIRQSENIHKCFTHPIVCHFMVLVYALKIPSSWPPPKFLVSIVKTF